MIVLEGLQYERVVDDICQLNWHGMNATDTTNVAWAYYHFSIQFRESLESALRLYPEDANLHHLASEECDTSNLSPWPGVAVVGERMNHDEFMRRTLALTPIDAARQAQLEAVGQAYLAATRRLDPMTQAMSIASYEDGGLEKVFGAILSGTHWDTPLLAAFKHFLSEHIRFDSNPDQGHGALSRHIGPDDRVLPLWTAFYDLLVGSVPRLLT